MSQGLSSAPSSIRRLGGFTGAVVCGAVLSQGLLSCARMEAPSGGPEDNRPPVVVSTEPDTFAVVRDFDGPVVFRFSERISERPQGGTVEDAVVVSPPTSAVEVDFQRSAIEVSLADGFEPGRVYRVRVNPVVVDMFSNPMLAPFELVFSTGAEFSSGVVAGVVRDRITGEPVSGARVHARPSGEPEAAPNVSRTDEDGIFALRYLPPASYEVTAFDDRNRSGAVEEGEPRRVESVTLEGASDTVLVSLAVLAPDTTPARVARVEPVDSAALRITTDDYLDPSESLDAVQVILSRQGAAAPSVESLLHAHEWRARADSLAAAADTGAADADGAGQPTGPGGGAGRGAGAGAGVGAAGAPTSEQELYGLLEGSLEAGVEYEVSVSGIVNIAGTPGGGGLDTLVWEPPPPDTTTAAPDSAGANGAGPPDGPGAGNPAPPPDR